MAGNIKEFIINSHCTITTSETSQNSSSDRISRSVTSHYPSDSIRGFYPLSYVDKTLLTRSSCSITVSYSRMFRRNATWRQKYPRAVNINLLTILIVLLNCWTRAVYCQPPPLPAAGFLDFENLPITRFSCEGKVIGGYYADVETGCQMFHVCTLGQKDEVQDIKFLCLNGTVFDQETRVCERVDEVDCLKAEQFFDLNLDLYVDHATTQKPEEENASHPLKTTKANAATTTKPTTTTPKTTASPRTRSPSATSTRSPIISSSSEEDEDSQHNGYTSFNYFLKTPHSHVASGYNSHSRQSYIINQPGPSIARSTSSNSSNVGRKVSSGEKTIVYTSAPAPASTARPKTVVIVTATLPQVKPKLTKQQPTSTTTTQPKFELDDQYEEYYDEDYPEQPSFPAIPLSKQVSSQSPRHNGDINYTVSTKPTSAFTSGLDFRDGRSTKSEENAGSIIGNRSESKSRKVSVAISSRPSKKPESPQATTTVATTEVFGNNSTEDPYYYEDDYPESDDVLQQNHQIPLSVLSVSFKGNGMSSGSNRHIPTATSDPSKNPKIQDTENDKKNMPSTSLTNSDYYDDDNDGVNAHDHHFTHVDVPRIPFAKPNVPRVLVTNGKPFLPRLRRQSLHNHYSHQQQPFSDFLLPALPSRPSKSKADQFQIRKHGNSVSSAEFRREARAKAIQSGKDYSR
ncbi:unnamed protein product [Orchesella dallaii]|uniref:Chitin-binding type-2 domain-containing protein n=1 Tax=Orchesella dallaii TaxID=48710 RepID=A0ABP1S0B4_9HEXA